MSEFVTIKRFPTHEVSRDGVVRRLDGKVVAQALTDRGYLRVGLSGKNLRVHRLVAETFIDNPKGLTEVNHIDGNKANNSTTNLEWSDRLSNMRHAFATGLISPLLHGERARRAKLKDADAVFIKQNYKRGHKVFGAGALAAKYGVHMSTICKISSGINWTNTTVEA
jgi:hypothetical protein